ncbi:glycosyltransferase [Tamlana sp. 2_MG-2023]|uniref:glycosyltransferase family 2 protein n=1 Tax=unclassified Tamlana TaxID=2614803 RepID=UPI0026E150E3|nr:MULTISPECIES: glycosyltransferase [unclassified Tamlana]MDO6758744.1 glycosyltransferase [Tamlana sp. 2_MG-2023]MDO6789443.1 glycosyltransferase [Tamlana sp. 1_MG-2023]
MRGKPLISVVLPVFNVEKYIKECMDSILSQTIQDFEIIVIDDCSTDNTLVVVESYKDTRIRIIKKTKNKGLVDSLNIGFKEAKGKYIARVDGDDINVLTRFEKQLKILESNNGINACGCWLQQFGEVNRVLKHKEFHDEIVARMLLHCSMNIGAVMFERNAVKNYKFNQNKTHVEDYDFWVRIAWHCKFYNIQEVLYYYRVHKTQVTNIYREHQIKADIPIKLILFKKLNYNTKAYSDELITKMLLLNKTIEVKEVSLFINWLKELSKLNKKYKVYSQKELVPVLRSILRILVFYLYFKKKAVGVDKKMRKQLFFKLPMREILFVTSVKGREIKKTFFQK